MFGTTKVITNLCPPSNTEISGMINLDDFLKLIELLEIKGIDYALVGGVAMMAIAPRLEPPTTTVSLGKEATLKASASCLKFHLIKTLGDIDTMQRWLTRALSKIQSLLTH